MDVKNETRSAKKTQAHKHFHNDINWSGSSDLSRNSTGPNTSLLNPTSI